MFKQIPNYSPVVPRFIRGIQKRDFYWLFLDPANKSRDDGEAGQVVTQTLAIFLIFFLSVFTLTGCLGPIKTPPVKAYTLSIEPFIQPPPRHRGNAVLLIATPTASPGFETSDMIYTENNHQLSHFAHSRWVGPPAQMLAPLLSASIQNTGCFRAVVTSAYSATANYTLNTQLLTLQQEFTENRSDVRLALQLTLIDNATSEVIANRQLEVIVPAMEKNPYAGVVSANRAVREILFKTNHFVCKARGY